MIGRQSFNLNVEAFAFVVAKTLEIIVVIANRPLTRLTSIAGRSSVGTDHRYPRSIAATTSAGVNPFSSYERIRDHRHIGVLQRRIDTDHLRVGLGIDETGKTVVRTAADAAASFFLFLVQHHAYRQAEELVAAPLPVVV
jgi:hypothetical protein